MPPNATSIVECTGVLNEADAETIDGGLDKNVVELKHANDRKIKLVWRNILIFGYVHLAAVYGAYLMITSARLYTGLFGKRCITIITYLVNDLLPHLPHFRKLDRIAFDLLTAFFFSLNILIFVAFVLYLSSGLGITGNNNLKTCLHFIEAVKRFFFLFHSNNNFILLSHSRCTSSLGTSFV